jgi:hypothetical protein
MPWAIGSSVKLDSSYNVHHSSNGLSSSMIAIYRLASSLQRCCFVLLHFQVMAAMYACTSALHTPAVDDSQAQQLHPTSITCCSACCCC